MKGHPFVTGFLTAAGAFAFVMAARVVVRVIWPDQAEEGATA